MATYSKTIEFNPASASTPIIPPTLVAASSAGTPVIVNVASLMSFDYAVFFGRQNTANYTVNSVMHCEKGFDVNGVFNWVECDRFTSKGGNTIVGPSIAASAASGQKIVQCVTTSFALDDLVFIQDGTTMSNSEWGIVTAINGTPSITLLTNLQATHATGNVWRGAEQYVQTIDCSSCNYVRFWGDNLLNSTTGGSVFQVIMNSTNSFS